MRKVKKGIEALLKYKGYYPLNSASWNMFFINHYKPMDDIEKQRNIQLTEANVTDKKGVYVYVNHQNEVLYVGKGSPIISRLKSHYDKLSRTKLNNRTAFFQAIQGSLQIHWLEISEAEDRELVEHLLVLY